MEYEIIFSIGKALVKVISGDFYINNEFISYFDVKLNDYKVTRLENIKNLKITQIDK